MAPAATSRRVADSAPIGRMVETADDIVEDGVAVDRVGIRFPDRSEDRGKARDKARDKAAAAGLARVDRARAIRCRSRSQGSSEALDPCPRETERLLKPVWTSFVA